MSIKISFLHYMKWTRVILPAVFKEFEVVCIFLAIFFFSLQFSIGKRSTLAKIWGEGYSPPSPSRFLRACNIIQLITNKSLSVSKRILKNMGDAKHFIISKRTFTTYSFLFITVKENKVKLEISLSDCGQPKMYEIRCEALH